MLRMFAKTISYVMLVWTVAPAIAFWMGKLSLESTKLQMLIATVIWFVVAPLWMREVKPEHVRETKV